jgi:scyllo-inositol 2-dehydrogenase (NADP+)
MENRTFGVGLLGWGNAGRFFHAPLIQVVPGLELVAVVTSRPQVKASLPDVLVLDSVEVLVADPRVDLVVVATPHRLHMAHAQAALLAGKHVVVEKPLVESAAEAQTLMQLARDVDRMVIAFQNRRWDGDFLTVKQVIGSGVLGDVYYFESHWSLYRPRLRGVWRENPGDLGGVLYDLGPHLIDQAMQLFGAPQSVYAQIETHRAGGQVDDLFRIHLRFPSGLSAVLVTDMMAPIPGPRFHVRGHLGTFEKHGLDPQEALLRAGHPPQGDTWGVDEPSNWGRLWTTDYAGLTVDGRVTTVPGDYRRFYQTVYQALVNNGPSPIDPVDVIVQLNVVEAAIRSANTNTVQVIG